MQNCFQKHLLTATGTALIALPMVMTADAQAATFTFPGSLDNQGTATFVQDGITLTLSNAQSNNGLIDADGDGLFFDAGTQDNMFALDFTFDQAVTITAYTISLSGGDFSHQAQTLAIGSTSGLSTAFGTYNINIPVAANTPITFLESSGAPDAFGVFNISQITVTPAAPPATMPEPSIILGLLGVASLGRVMGRKQQEK